MSPAMVLEALCALSRDRFDAGCNKVKLRRWQCPPELSVFLDGCRDFREAVASWGLAERRRFVDDVRVRFERLKDQARLLTYDDMLVRVRRALDGGGMAATLLRRLRRRHRVAIVDEFQDTDSVQWDIFARVFGEGSSPLVLVGDPKQAIYSFRSGDVYTYFDAAKTARRRYTLDCNHRSEARVVEAVNELFARRGDRAPFVDEETQFHPQRARGLPLAASLTVGGTVARRPFVVRWVPSAAPGKVLPKGRALVAVCTDVADEVVALLTDDTVRLGGRPVVPSDICVLTTTHAQGEALRKRLQARSVPAVLQRSGNVFYEDFLVGDRWQRRLRPETRDLLTLVDALAAPHDERAVRTALASELFPLSALDIFAMFVEDTDPDRRDAALETFTRARRRGERGSFIAAFDEIDGAFGVREHLLAHPGGERLLTNVLHQVEMVDDHLRRRRVGLGAAAAWLRSLPARSSDETEQHEIRLETDAGAVQVMTVFKSKGLEFPIVFVPFLWSSGFRRKAPPYLLYHEACGVRRRLVVDLSPAGADAALRARADDEVVAEKLRLTYVAVTRAIHRTYLYTGPINGAEGTGPARLFHGADATAAAFAVDDVLPFSEGAIALETVMPRPPSCCVATAAALRAEDVNWRRWPSGRAIEDEWCIQSFTRLCHGDEGAFEGGYDFDQASASVEEPTDEEGTAGRGEVAAIMQFPAGVMTGKAWHEVFERVPYDAAPLQVRGVVVEILQRYGLVPAEDAVTKELRLAAVTSMVQRVLGTPLSEDGGLGPRLCEVLPGDRVCEMTFDFALRPGATMADLDRELTGAWPAWHSLGGRFRERRDSLGEGFMTGAIDLVFRRSGSAGDVRHSIVDWKSNRIGRTLAGYDRRAVEREVIKRGYALQYLLYTVALDGHLSRCLPDYDYERNFGAVYYVFLRGVDGRPGHAVHVVRPPAAAITALSSLLRGGTHG